MKHPVVRIPRVIAYYRISPGAMTSDLERMSRAQMQFIAKHRGGPGCDEHAYKQAVSSVFRQRAEVHASRGQIGLALRDIIFCLTALSWQLSKLASGCIHSQAQPVEIYRGVAPAEGSGAVAALRMLNWSRSCSRWKCGSLTNWGSAQTSPFDFSHSTSRTPL